MSLNIVLASVPFEGHLQPLLRFGHGLKRTHPLCNIHLIVCGWAEPPKPDTDAKADGASEAKEMDRDCRRNSAYYMNRFPWLSSCSNLRANPLTETHAAEFNVSRATELRELFAFTLGRVAANEPYGLDWLIYDFFVLEAHHVKLETPDTTRVACVVPAFVSPTSDPPLFSDHPTWPRHATALAAMDIETKDVPCYAVSDAFLLAPPGLQLWTYGPAALHEPVPIAQDSVAAATSVASSSSSTSSVTSSSRLIFDAILPEMSVRLDTAHDIKFGSDDLSCVKPELGTLLISFGTVVLGNLWHNNTHAHEAIADALAHFIVAGCNMPYFLRVHIVLATDDTKDLEEIRRQTLTKMSVLPDKAVIIWSRTIDQCAELASGRVGVFVTHGGCASIREALLFGVRTVVVPFFGDQHEVARHIQSLQLGVAALYDTTLDLDEKEDKRDPTRKRWLRTSIDSSTKCQKLIESVLDIPSSAFSRYTFERARLWQDWNHVTDKILNVHSPVAHWGPLDLLYGTNEDRVAFANTQPKPHLFGVGDTSFRGTPRLIDHIHDKLVSPPTEPTSTLPDVRKYGDWLIETKRLAPLHRFPTRAEVDAGNEDALSTLWSMCMAGISYFTSPDAPHRTKIHIAMGRGFMAGRNKATTQELQYVLDHWDELKDRVVLYLQRADAPSPEKVKEAHDALVAQVIRDCTPKAGERKEIRGEYLVTFPLDMKAPESPFTRECRAYHAWLMERSRWRRCISTDEQREMLTYALTIGQPSEVDFATRVGLQGSEARQLMARSQNLVAEALDRWFPSDGCLFGFEGRVKKVESAFEKAVVRRLLPIYDIVAHRIVMETSTEVAQVARHFLQWSILSSKKTDADGRLFSVVRSRCSERGRVWHFLCETLSDSDSDVSQLFEVQVWTHTMLQVFCIEHDRVYKARAITPRAAALSAQVRQHQHTTQDAVDTLHALARA